MTDGKEPGQAIRESRLDSIQVLRGLAALYVTVYHLKDVMKADDPFRKEIDFFFASGPAGVSLFFVISGFIMVYITRHARTSVSDVLVFLRRRLIRIWPAYAIVTLAYCFLQSRMTISPEWPTELAKSLVFVPLGNFPAPFFGYAILNVGWSLNYEVYFYLIIALSMLFARARWLVFLLIVLVTLVGIPAWFGSFTFKADKTANLGIPYLNMITNPIIWNFVSGVVAGLIYNHAASRRRLSAWLGIPMVAPTMLTIALWQFLSGFLGGFGPFEWGMGSAAIFFVFVFHYENKIQRFPAWLTRLGDISFSIYLLHVPVVVGLEFFFRRLGLPAFAEGIALFLLSLSLTCIAANLSYELLEIRLSSALRDWLHPGRSIQLQKETEQDTTGVQYPPRYHRHHS